MVEQWTNWLAAGAKSISDDDTHVSQEVNGLLTNMEDYWGQGDVLPRPLSMKGYFF